MNRYYVTDVQYDNDDSIFDTNPDDTVFDYPGYEQPQHDQYPSGVIRPEQEPWEREVENRDRWEPEMLSRYADQFGHSDEQSWHADPRFTTPVLSHPARPGDMVNIHTFRPFKAGPDMDWQWGQFGKEMTTFDPHQHGHIPHMTARRPILPPLDQDALETAHWKYQEPPELGGTGDPDQIPSDMEQMDYSRTSYGSSHWGGPFMAPAPRDKFNVQGMPHHDYPAAKYADGSRMSEDVNFMPPEPWNGDFISGRARSIPDGFGVTPDMRFRSGMGSLGDTAEGLAGMRGQMEEYPEYADEANIDDFMPMNHGFRGGPDMDEERMEPHFVLHNAAMAAGNLLHPEAKMIRDAARPASKAWSGQGGIPNIEGMLGREGQMHPLVLADWLEENAHLFDPKMASLDDPPEVHAANLRKWFSPENAWMLHAATGSHHTPPTQASRYADGSKMSKDVRMSGLMGLHPQMAHVDRGSEDFADSDTTAGFGWTGNNPERIGLPHAEAHDRRFLHERRAPERALGQALESLETDLVPWDTEAGEHYPGGEICLPPHSMETLTGRDGQMHPLVLADWLEENATSPEHIAHAHELRRAFGNYVPPENAWNGRTEPTQASRYAQTNYADDSDVQNLLAQLAHPQHNHTRWGTPEHPENDRTFRMTLADALRDVGRDREADWVQDLNRHILVGQDGQVVPGRFTHEPAFGAYVDALNNLNTMHEGDYPEAEFDLLHPGREGEYRPEDFHNREEAEQPIPPGHFRFVHMDPGGYDLHVAEDAHGSDIPRRLSEILEENDELTGAWQDRDDAENGQVDEWSNAIRNAPFEEPDTDSLREEPPEQYALNYAPGNFSPLGRKRRYLFPKPVRLARVTDYAQEDENASYANYGDSTAVEYGQEIPDYVSYFDPRENPAQGGGYEPEPAQYAEYADGDVELNYEDFAGGMVSYADYAGFDEDMIRRMGLTWDPTRVTERGGYRLKKSELNDWLEKQKTNPFMPGKERRFGSGFVPDNRARKGMPGGGLNWGQIDPSKFPAAPPTPPPARPAGTLRVGTASTPEKWGGSAGAWEPASDIPYPMLPVTGPARSTKPRSRELSWRERAAKPPTSAARYALNYAEPHEYPEHQQFLAAIHQNPLESTAHHAHADWLEENGFPDEAAFRRSMANWMQTTPPDYVENPPGYEPNSRPWYVHGVSQGRDAAKLPEGVKSFGFHQPDFPGSVWDLQGNRIGSTPKPHHALWTEPDFGFTWAEYPHMEQAFRENFAKNRQREQQEPTQAARYAGELEYPQWWEDEQEKSGASCYDDMGMDSGTDYGSLSAGCYDLLDKLNKMQAPTMYPPVEAEHPPTPYMPYADYCPSYMGRPTGEIPPYPLTTTALDYDDYPTGFDPMESSGAIHLDPDETGIHIDAESGHFPTMKADSWEMGNHAWDMSRPFPSPSWGVAPPSGLRNNVFPIEAWEDTGNAAYAQYADDGMEHPGAWGPSHQDFLNKIHENPDEATNALAYADWLEENGNAAAAHIIRQHVGENAAEGEEPEAGGFADVYRPGYGEDHEPGEFVLDSSVYNDNTTRFRLKQRSGHQNPFGDERSYWWAYDEPDPEKANQIVTDLFQSGVKAAKGSWHQPPKPPVVGPDDIDHNNPTQSARYDDGDSYGASGDYGDGGGDRNGTTDSPHEGWEDRDYWRGGKLGYSTQGPTMYVDENDLKFALQNLTPHEFRGRRAHPGVEINNRLAVADMLRDLGWDQEADLMANPDKHVYWNGSEIANAHELSRALHQSRNPIGGFADRNGRNYLQTALWSSTDDEGNSLDREHTPADIHHATLAAMLADWEHFNATSPYNLGSDHDSHNFWLSRNGHGAGFFNDDEWTPEQQKEMQELAKRHGEYNLHVGDDGMIHGDYEVEPEPDEPQEPVQLSRYADLPSEHTDISPTKARTILHDGSVRGHPLTDKQRRFFGAMSHYSAGNPTHYADMRTIRALLKAVRENPYEETLHGELADALEELHPDSPFPELIRRQFGLGQHAENGPRDNLWHDPVQNSWDGTFPYTSRLGKHGPFNLYLGHEEPNDYRHGLFNGENSNARWVVHAVSPHPETRDTGFSFEFPHEEAHMIPQMFPKAGFHIRTSPENITPENQQQDAERFNDLMDEQERNRG